MAEKKETTQADGKHIEVELIDKHTHQGKLYLMGDKITVRKRQLKKLQEWGKVK
ncbi:MAG: hypothetical protein ACD_75C01687G0003 [uncultured bacterium]|nr:MAG: hypothetical protein ACD_75C01687G0003 [uncultured bacterium]